MTWGWSFGLLVVCMLIAWVIDRPKVKDLPTWARSPCGICQGKMRWQKNASNPRNDAACFCCQSCGHKEYRGGWNSEADMANWDKGL